MLTKSEFSTLLKAVGEPVVFTQVKAPNATANVKAIVEPFRREETELINAYGINGMTVQVLAGDLPITPQKFDTFHLATGKKMTINEPIEQRERGNGNLAYYIIYCKG